MLQSLRNAWHTPDLRRRILFTLLIVLLYRLGANIPVPYISAESMSAVIASASGSLFQYMNLLSGDAFSKATLFALSVSPYITASIVIQLLTIAIPALERLSKEGEEGKKKITTITRYVTVALALITSYGYYMLMRNYGLLTQTSAFYAVVIIASYAAGAALVMWLAEKINENGIGNGISLILFAGIVSRVPAIIYQMVMAVWRSGKWYYLIAPLALISLLAMIVYICFMDGAERKIPVQYAKKVVGRKMYGGQSSNIPIKVNMSGVLPVIFASSILSLPPTIEMFIDSKLSEESFWHTFFGWFKADHWVYGIIYFLLIIFFAYFYSSIQYNPVDMANNLAKNSGMIPGIRSGKPTAEHIAKIISRMVLLGALMLSVCALFPILFAQITTAVGYGDIDVSIGGTSIIILVGVALETVAQIESQMMMRHYKGFLD